MNKRILALAIPNIIANITVPLLGMIDIAIAGRLGDESYIGSIALGTTIFNFIYWNFGFLRMGTSGFAAQALGARNFAEIMNTLVRAMAIALGVGFLILILQKPIAQCAFYFIGGSETTENLALRYYNIRIWAAPAALGIYAMKGWLIGMQNSITPMITAILINLVNIVLCLLFVYVWDMDIEGIALGTALAQYSGFLFLVFFGFARYRKLISYINLHESLKWQSMKGFFKVNSDIFLRTLCLIAVFTFIPAVSAKMGDDILAINTLLMQFFTLFSYIMDGFAYAGEALAGKQIGAHNPKGLKQTIRLLFRWGAILSFLFMILYGFFGKHLLSLFTDQISIINLSGDYLYWVLLFPLAGFGAFLWDGIYVGATASKSMRNSMYISTAVFFAAYYLLYSIWDNNALWLAFILYLAFRSLLLTLQAKKHVYRKAE